MKKVVLLLSLVVLMSCNNDNGSDTNNSDGYDRIALLNAVVENNILPAYEDFDAQLTSLDTDINAFVSNPSTSTLESVKTSYLNAYKVWQHIEMFNVLLASSTGYKEDINTYPVDVTEIESFIDGSFGQAISEINFTSTSKNDAQGFPAIDYLINNGEDIDVISNFSIGNYTNEYKELLVLYIDRMVTLTNAIITDWNTNNISFIVDNSNSLTSSFNLFINDYIFYIEQGFREPKIAFPAGVRENVNANVTRIESYYSPENSKILFEEAYKAVKNVFTGTPYNKEYITPIGINNYLDAVNAEVFINNESIDLADYIENTLFIDIEKAVIELDTNLATQIETDNSKMENTFNAVQEFVIAIKVNVLESFSVDVDYVDSDGD